MGVVVERFSPAVWRLTQRGRVVLWHGQTGRHAALSEETLEEIERWAPSLPPPPTLAAIAQRLTTLHLLAEAPPPELTALRPARSRHALLFPEENLLWTPMPGVRTPGGFAYAARTLSPTQIALWRASNGARTTAEVAERCGCSVDVALAFFAELTHPSVQAMQLRRRPTRARDPSLLHLIAPDRPPAPRPAHLYGPNGETTLEHWHVHDILDGERHFDDRETTVAHAFALPHPGLHAQPYGARLHEALEERGLLPEGDGVVLEIGPGDGELGAAWRERAARRGRPAGEHIRLDISPTLLATQRQRQPGTREILGSATDIPLPARSVSLVLCNEVIADLTAVPHDPQAPTEGEAAQALRQRLRRYAIPEQTGRSWYNLGAWQLLEELDRVLAPGGAAVLTEFGALDERPRETEQLDHPEVSIRFDHLIRIAQARGLQAQCLPLADLMGFDLQAQWLARHSYEALRAWMRARGHHLEARAWTPETLTVPCRVEGLEWTALSNEGPGPLITRFQALLIRR